MRPTAPHAHARRHGEILETVAYANAPDTNVNTADTALLVTNVQCYVLDWVELQASTVGEAVVAAAVTVSTVLQ